MSERKEAYYPIVDESRVIDRGCNRFFLHMHLHAIRQRYGWTQQDIADATGMSPSTISRVETGKDVDLSTIIKYADAIGYEIVLRKKENGSS